MVLYSRGALLLVACASVSPGSSSAPQSALSPGTLSPGTAGASAAEPSSAASTIEVAVSVDDLPAHGPLAPGVTRLEIARRMLDAFARHHVPAVYGFVNGKLVDVEPESVAILRAWLQAGYPLGNHSYSHMSLHAAELADYFADIERGEVVLNNSSRIRRYGSFSAIRTCSRARRWRSETPSAPGFTSMVTRWQK